MYIDKIEFPIYGIFILISLLMGVICNWIYLKKNNVKNQDIVLFVIMIFIFALFGGELLNFLLTDSREYKFTLYGLSSYGGAIGILLASIVFGKINAENKLFLKSAVLSLPLIYSISKLACFFAGCCYGGPCNSKFCVVYTFGLNIPLIPVQLIETITFMIVFIICLSLRKNKEIISITIILSAISKFLLDYLRYDHLDKVITKNQIISIVFVIIGIVTILYKYIKNNKIKLEDKRKDKIK